MEITETSQGAVQVIKPNGPLVESDAEQFRARALDMNKQSMGRFVVDATDIPFVDSKGLESLVDIGDEIAESGRAMKLCGANETIREVLEITDVNSMFEHYEDVKDAVRSFI